MIEVPLWLEHIMTALIAAGSGFLIARSTRKPPSVTIQEQINASFAGLIQGYEKHIATLSSQVAELKAEVGSLHSDIDDLNAHIDFLTAAFEAAGLKPPPRKRRTQTEDHAE
jgi:hypothetical protein